MKPCSSLGEECPRRGFRGAGNPTRRWRMKRARLFVIAMVVAGVTAVSALPAAAQPQQDGLVNVNLNDIQIGVPIAVAANICDLDVNVLAEQRSLGNTACDVTADAGTTFGPSQGGGSPRQEGLVNV